MTVSFDISGARLSSHPVVRADIERVLAADLPWHDLDGQTILITGANGFLPAAMVEVLLTLASRHIGPRPRVVALVRSRARAEERFAAWCGHPSLEIVEHDASKPLEWHDAADVIVHAASQASPKYYGSDPVGTALPNVAGTAHLLDLAARCGTSRFLYFSSSEVYGSLEPGASAREDVFGPLDPATVRACYAESKRMGETLCVAYANQHGVPAVIVRPFHTYGPGMRLDDGRVFCDFVRDAVAGRDIQLNSAGLAERAFCYLADATEGFFTALLKGTPATAYNVGNADAVVSIRALAELIAGLDPEQRIRARIGGDTSVAASGSGYIASTVQRSAPDVARIASLGWRPVTGLTQGFSRTIEVYRDLARSQQLIRTSP